MDAKRLTLIKNYLANFEIKHRDVQAELLDHFATAVGQIENSAPHLSFKEAMMQAHRNFGGQEGFRQYRLSAETRVNKKTNRIIAEVLQSFLTWPYMLALLLCIAISYSYSLNFVYGSLSLVVLSFLFIGQAVLLYFKYRGTEFFLVRNSLRHLAWLFYGGVYLPHYFIFITVSDRSPMPFWFQVFWLSFTLLLWTAFWRVPGKLENRAEHEYPRAMA